MTSPVPQTPEPTDEQWAPSFWDALEYPAERGCRQVVMTEDVWKDWLRLIYMRGLYVFPIPVSDDDLPTYGVGARL